MTSLEGLNMDVIIMEILPSLPSKALIRFKSVCKSWNSVISSRDFVRLYLRHQSLSSSEADKRLILAGDKRINCYQLDPHATTTTTTFDYSKTSRYMSVIGTSNGLLCICLSKGNFSEYCILNPTTRIYLCIRNTLHEELGFVHSHGFGFDHENLDYIIVVVSEYRDNSAVKTRITSMYSLNKNTWSVVDEITFPTDNMHQLRKYGVLIDNNLLHWMFWMPALQKHRIGCFDICKNKWTDDVVMPRFYYDPTCNKETYLVDIKLNDDCLSSTFMDVIENRYYVWVMKEYGIQDSWVMLLSIPVSSCFDGKVITLVASCRSSDMVLLRQRYTSKFLWYNKVNGGIREAKFDGAPNFWNIQDYICSRSLVDAPNFWNIRKLFEHTFFTTLAISKMNSGTSFVLMKQAMSRLYIIRSVSSIIKEYGAQESWVMKEYGVQESWVMLLSIPGFNCLKIRGGINLVACCQSSDIVLVLVRLRYSRRLFWYNAVDGVHSEAKFDVAPDFWDNIHAYMCSRSLVHLPGEELFEHS
ncbi:F-box/kelch-repeat protein At3g23880-like [Silene latifolia]|uniref:F-box/kelch-repeat protein At3g23880-like n=1 Tax=Silene latifolia TaxID=37657 RepID=UPI003D777FD7